MKYLLLLLMLGACASTPNLSQGVYKYPSGLIYKGTLRDGIPWGSGSVLKPDGTLIEASFYGNTYAFTKGKITSPNGDIFEVSATQDKTKYRTNEKKTSQNRWGIFYKGKVSYKDGSLFEGNLNYYLNRFGEGTYHSKYALQVYSKTWRNRNARKARIHLSYNRTYIGNIINMWPKDRVGQMTNDKNEIIRGNFISSHSIEDLVIYKKIIEPGYTGFTKGGKKYGFGLLVYPDKSYYRGGFWHDNYHGHGYLYQGNYKLRGKYIKGKKHGAFAIFDREKRILEKVNFVRDKVSGFSTIIKRGLIYSVKDYRHNKVKEYRFMKSSFERHGVGQKLSPADKTKAYYRIFADGFPGARFYYTSENFTQRKQGYLISKDSRYLILNAKIKKYNKALNIINKDASRSTHYLTRYKLIAGELVRLGDFTDGFVGNFKNGVFRGEEIDSKGNLLYSGTYGLKNRDGKGVCRFDITMEPCEYENGKRIDEFFILREKAKVELGRVQSCKVSWDDIQKTESFIVRRMDSMCDDEVKNVVKALEYYAKDIECIACGRGDARDSFSELNDCSKGMDLDDQLRSITRIEKRLNDNKCEGREQLPVMRTARLSLISNFNSAQSELRNQVSDLRNQRDNIQSAKEKFEEEDQQRRNQQFLKNISSTNSFYQNMQKRNTQMTQAFMNQYLEHKQRRERDNLIKKKAYQRHKRKIINPYQGSPKKYSYFSSAKKSCRKRAGKWNGTRNTCVIKAKYNLPKYAPTVWKPGNNKGYVIDNSYVSNKSKKTSSSSSSNIEKIKKEIKMDEPKWESIAICWTNQKGKLWWCDGPVQKLQVGENDFSKAAGHVGCKNWSDDRTAPYPGKELGKILYCKQALETYDRDIATIYNVKRSVHARRIFYQCKKNYLGRCTRPKQ